MSELRGGSVAMVAKVKPGTQVGEFESVGQRKPTPFDPIRSPCFASGLPAGRLRGGEGATAGFTRRRHLVPLEQAIRANESVIGQFAHDSRLSSRCLIGRSISGELIRLWLLRLLEKTEDDVIQGICLRHHRCGGLEQHVLAGHLRRLVGHVRIHYAGCSCPQVDFILLENPFRIVQTGHRSTVHCSNVCQGLNEVHEVGHAEVLQVVRSFKEILVVVRIGIQVSALLSDVDIGGGCIEVIHGSVYAVVTWLQTAVEGIVGRIEDLVARGQESIGTPGHVRGSHASVGKTINELQILVRTEVYVVRSLRGSAAANRIDVSRDFTDCAKTEQIGELGVTIVRWALEERVVGIQEVRGSEYCHRECNLFLSSCHPSANSESLPILTSL